VRICIVIDKWGWAYDRIAQALIKFNKSEHQLEVYAAKTDAKKIKRSKADRFLVMGYQCWDKVGFLPKDRTFVGVHGHHQWDGHKTTPEVDVAPPAELHEFLSSFKGVNVVSEKLHGLFPYATYTPNGVDCDTFRCEVLPCQREELVVGTAFNPKHDWRKGVEEFVRPACKRVGATLSLAPRDRPLREMPAWYNSIDVYVCASSSEGLSLAVLEAMACGRYIVSTIPNEIEAQIVMERSVTGIEMGIRRLYDIDKYYPEARERWSWEKRSKAWIEFLES